MTADQLHRAAREMETGRHGRFSATIAAAYFAADDRNRERLIAAFGDLFARAYTFTHLKLEIVK